MIIVAASLYLPEHVMKMANRAWFYYAGDEAAAGVGTRAGPGAETGRRRKSGWGEGWARCAEHAWGAVMTCKQGVLALTYGTMAFSRMFIRAAIASALSGCSIES